MRKTARLALAMVLLMGGLVVLPRASSLSGVAAAAVPTPLLSELLGSPSPTHSSDGGGGSDDDSDDGSSGGGGGGGSGGSGSGGDSKDGSGGSGSGGSKDTKGDTKLGGKPGDSKLGGKKNKGRKDAKPRFVGTYRPTGPKGNFDTDELVSIAAHLRSLGWSARDVIAQVYPPFIIGGPAAWTNTWGAPRYGPGPLVRTHEGQDVFCSFGDPVLAPTSGRVSFDDGGLGGIVARVHSSDGSYWYLAHLSDINSDELTSGDFVEAGAVLGYCGNSGNALTTPPHVHFGWYQANGGARNPMARLIKWLHEAERRARGLVEQASTKRQKQITRLTAARRFGDAFVPGLAELSVPGESLLASGSNPATGTFGLAEAALQAALSGQFTLGVDSTEPIHLHDAGAGTTSAIDPDSELARLLRSTRFHSELSD